MTDRIPARGPSDDGIRVVGPNAQFECSICGDWVGRFTIRHHGQNQYCPDCWKEVAPHMVEKECRLCGAEYEQDIYQSNVVTFSYEGYEGECIKQTKLCDDCEEKVFGE